MPTSAFLHGYRLCPDSRFAMMMLGEYGVDAKFIEYQPWDIPESYYLINPSGKLPSYIDDDYPIRGANVIGEYLEDTVSNRKGYCFMGVAPQDRANIRFLISWISTFFYAEVTRPILDQRLYGKALSVPPDPKVFYRAQDAFARYNRSFCQALDQLDWLSGLAISQADFYLAAHISSLDYFGDVAWQNNSLRNWYARMKSRPSVRSVLALTLTEYKPPDYYMDPDF